MAKIPKNLSDKDMLQDFQEEHSLESIFLEAEAKDDKKRRKKLAEQPKSDLQIAYLTPDIIEKLGKLLLKPNQVQKTAAKRAVKTVEPPIPQKQRPRERSLPKS